MRPTDLTFAQIEALAAVRSYVVRTAEAQKNLCDQINEHDKIADAEERHSENRIAVLVFLLDLQPVLRDIALVLDDLTSLSQEHPLLKARNAMVSIRSCTGVLTEQLRQFAEIDDADQGELADNAVHTAGALRDALMVYGREIALALSAS